MVKYLSIIFFIIGCSSNSLNYVKSGSFYIDQGAYSSGRWESSLRFSRVSYMNGMTMVYDILVSDPIKDSDFKMWLGESTRASAEGCTYPIAIGIFSGRDFKVDNQDVFNQILKSRGRFLDSYEFVKNLSFHPAYNKNSFNIYRFEVACLDKKEPIYIDIPGFTKTKIN